MPGELTDQDVERICRALDDAQHARPWPSAMQLSTVLDELRLWLDDDRQWESASPRNWQSLLQELERAVEEPQQPDRLLQLVGEPAQVRAELSALSSAQKDAKHRSELTQRKKLERFIAVVREGLQSARAVEVAWDCLIEETRDPRFAAERFLAYARWAGHDAERLRKAIDRDLVWWDHEGPAPSNGERLERVRDRLRAASARGDVVVWLLIRYARVGDPPVLPVGPNVTLYDGDWLAAAIGDGDDGLPIELRSNAAGASYVERLTRDHGDEGDAVSNACVRVVIDDVIRADAVTIARNTASTIGAFGVLYGGAVPSLWRVDPSFVTFYGDRLGPTTFRQSEVGTPTYIELFGSDRDQTAFVLGESEERFGDHLPIRDGQMMRVAQTLRWLRDARVSQPPARLVLCARAIEVVSAWAGFAAPDRFVAHHLARSWAWTQVLRALDPLAISLIFGDKLIQADDALAHDLVHQLLADPEFKFERTDHEGYRYDPGALARKLDWLRDNLPAGSGAAKELRRVAHHFASPKATLAWYDALYRQAMDNESRRVRTRNAIMHGGPLSDETIEMVVPFAEYMASEAVDVALEAHLASTDVADFVIERGARFDTFRQQLKSGVPPADVLFSGGG